MNFFCHASPKRDAQRETAWRDTRSLLRRIRPLCEHDLSQVLVAPPLGRRSRTCSKSSAPAVVSFHFGLPSTELLTRVRNWGSKVLSSATTVDEARWLEARGVDAIIAQGVEAGGHRGMFLSDDLTNQLGTLALVPQIMAAVKTPVIAAGGIADAKGVRAALALGAAGVQVGTAYLLCAETTTSAVHRAALKSEAARHTVLTNVFTGRPARAIVNRFVKEVGPINPSAPAFPLAATAVAPLRPMPRDSGAEISHPCGPARTPSAAKRSRQRSSRGNWPLGSIESCFLSAALWRTPFAGARWILRPEAFLAATRNNKLLCRVGLWLAPADVADCVTSRQSMPLRRPLHSDRESCLALSSPDRRRAELVVQAAVVGVPFAK